MQTRKLGKTDLEPTVIGFGGVVVCDETQDDANRMIAEAFDAGIRYFDVAPQYGNAQQRMGPALEPYRDNVMLACKTLERTADGARKELEDSLTKLRTDHFDLYQAHAVSSLDEAKQILGPGGAIEAFKEAQQAGKVRYIGFSAHDEEAALHLVESGLFASALFPLNYTVLQHDGFGKNLIEAANAKGMGLLSLKAIARTKIPQGGERSHKKCWYVPEDRRDVAHLMLRYVLNLPGVAAAVPPGDPGLFKMVMGFADNIDPLNGEELAELEEAVGENSPLFPLQTA